MGKLTTYHGSAVIKEFRFAWLPTTMIDNGQRIWFARYTAVYRWSTRENRYKLFWSTKGHVESGVIPL